MVQIVPPENWQAGGPGEAPASAASMPVMPPPLARAKVPTPELTSEAVEAAVAGVVPPPSAPELVAAGSGGSLAARFSAKALWLGAGAAGIAVASALIAVLIGAALNKSDSYPTIAKSEKTDSVPGSTAGSPPSAAEKVPSPDKAIVVAEPPSPSTVEKPTVENPAVESPSAPVMPPVTPEIKVASSGEKPAPASPPAKAIPIIDNKPDVDEDLDPIERSAGFAVRRGREAIDWPSRLTQPLAGLDCRDMPLADFADLMSNLGNAPISLNVDALAEIGVSPAAPLTVKIGNATFLSALDAGFLPRGLRAVAEGNHLLITRSGENAALLRSVPYSVADLAPDAAALGALGDAIRTLIAPDSWKESGGNATIAMADGSLVIEQTPAAHYQVVLLCEKLRVARGLPTKSKLDPAVFRLDPRSERAKVKLAQPVSAVFFRATSLPKVLDYLAKQTQTRLLVDYRALEFDGIAADVGGTLAAQAQPLGTALTSLLEPLQLAYRVVDEQTLQITTQRGFRRELELYRVANLLKSGVRPEQIMDRIANEVASGRWAVSGGKGVMHFDRASGCLLVSHSQLVQRDVQSLLTHWQQNLLTAKLPSPAK